MVMVRWSDGNGQMVRELDGSDGSDTNGQMVNDNGQMVMIRNKLY
jgi:hypothetical protein